jgi:multidrug efflux pump subunit AcrA (membrane-fusion protein)
MAIIQLAKFLPAKPDDAPQIEDVPAPTPDPDGHLSTRRLAIIGGIVVGVFVVGLGIWAAVAPLSAAIVAPGKVAVEGQWKVVEAPQTVMVTEVRVEEGQMVTDGDVLLRLDKTQFQAEYDSLRGRYLDLLGQQAKLRAEEQGADTVVFPPDLSDLTDPEVRRVVTMQEADFRARTVSLASTLSRIKGQLAVVQEELTALNTLDDDLVARSRTYPLRYSMAELRGQEMEIQLQRDADRAADLQRIESELAGVEPKMHAARAALDQLDIRATASGKVLNLAEHTVGGMVTVGEKIMDIVPSDMDLIIEASVKPDDIDDLSPGMEALVQLTALQRRTTPAVKGVVTYVAADRITTKDADYYAIKVRIDDGELKNIGAHMQLYPGMPAEVMIPTLKRTALDYMLQPLTDTVFRSFREP